MLSSITLRHQNVLVRAKEPIDLGLLAEAMLFYGSVHIVADHQILKQLIRDIGPDVLLTFLEQDYLEIDFLENVLGIYTHRSDAARPKHDPCVVRNERLSLHRLVQEYLEALTDRRGYSRRLASRLTPRIGSVFFDAEIPNQCRQDFADQGYVEESIKALLRAYAPSYELPNRFRFRLHREAKGFEVDTNLDYAAANRSYHQACGGSDSSLTDAYLLSHIQTIRSHLYFASEHNSEIAAEPVDSEIMRLKLGGFLTQPTGGIEQPEHFQTFLFPDGHSIAEAVNTKVRNFSDLRALLDRSRKFRHWLRDQSADAQLVKAYYDEVIRESWIDRLSPKTFKWFLFAAASLGAGIALDPIAGGLSGIALSAADTFLLERLLRGWRPNQFVEHSLRPFVQEGQS